MEKELKTLLRKLAAEYETKDFINDDPVRLYSGTQVGTDGAPKRCRSVPLLQMG